MKKKCKYPGCQTILSAYNKGSCCFSHLFPYIDFVEGKIKLLEHRVYRLRKNKGKKETIRALLRRISKYRLTI